MLKLSLLDMLEVIHMELYLLQYTLFSNNIVSLSHFQCLVMDVLHPVQL